MANTIIQLKRSFTPSTIPSSLANGELGLNTADGKLYANSTNGSIIQINHVPSTFGSVNVNGTFIVADALADILTLLPGQNITVTGDVGTDTVTISANIVPAFTRANDAFSLAQAAYGQANTGGLDTWVRNHANAAFDQANTGGGDTWVRPHANAAYDRANAAFDSAFNISVIANNALPNISGAVFNGELIVSANVSANYFTGNGSLLTGISSTAAYDYGTTLALKSNMFFL